MHTLFLLAAAALALPVAAQPDTTSARRWMPLDVGNVWDYDYPDPDPQYALRWRLAVASDTLVGGVRWARLTERRIQNDVLGPVEATALARFDGDTLRVAAGTRLLYTPLLLCSFAPGSYSASLCRLAWAPTGGFTCPTFMQAARFDTVTIAGQAMPWLHRSYSTAGCEVDGLYAVDIGQLGYGTLGGGTFLCYVRTRTAEFGAPLVVSNGPVPEVPSPALVVAPNPAVGVVRIEAPGASAVEVLDALGRVVGRASRVGATSWRLDVGGWAPGVYVVRAGAAATARMTVGR